MQNGGCGRELWNSVRKNRRRSWTAPYHWSKPVDALLTSLARCWRRKTGPRSRPFSHDIGNSQCSPPPRLFSLSGSGRSCSARQRACPGRASSCLRGRPRLTAFSSLYCGAEGEGFVRPFSNKLETEFPHCAPIRAQFTRENRGFVELQGTF